MDCEPDFDLPPQSGHAVPQWLRDHFSTIEDEAMQMGGCAVFTQMRTKVQAYFEMMRADLSYVVLLADRNQLKSANEALRKDAERYRWLRDQEAFEGGIAILPVGLWVKPAMLCTTPFDSGEMTDSVVDAAMAQDQQP